MGKASGRSEVEQMEELRDGRQEEGQGAGQGAVQRFCCCNCKWSVGAALGKCVRMSVRVAPLLLLSALICHHFFVVFSRCSQPREEVTLNFRLKFAQRQRQQQQERKQRSSRGGQEPEGKATAAGAAAANNVAYFLVLAVDVDAAAAAVIVDAGDLGLARCCQSC